MIWLLFGAPGSGKGTQSKILCEEFGFSHLSTGDLFRKHLKENTSLGEEARGYMDRGALVPDSIVIGMVDEELTQDKSYILDGFPRTLEQARALDELAEKVHLKIEGVLFLDVDHDALMERLSGRRSCTNCGEVYHVMYRATSKEGICDNCGGTVIQRDDDKEDVIEHRLSVYNEQTSPLMNFYDEKNMLHRIDGMGESKDVFERIKKFIKKDG